jgi:hypothetical protein
MCGSVRTMVPLIPWYSSTGTYACTAGFRKIATALPCYVATGWPEKCCNYHILCSRLVLQHPRFRKPKHVASTWVQVLQSCGIPLYSPRCHGSTYHGTMVRTMVRTMVQYRVWPYYHVATPYTYSVRTMVCIRARII